MMPLHGGQNKLPNLGKNAKVLYSRSTKNHKTKIKGLRVAKVQGDKFSISPKIGRRIRF